MVELADLHECLVEVDGGILGVGRHVLALEANDTARENSVRAGDDLLWTNFFAVILHVAPEHLLAAEHAGGDAILAMVLDVSGHLASRDETSAADLAGALDLEPRALLGTVLVLFATHDLSPALTAADHPLRAVFLEVRLDVSPLKNGATLRWARHLLGGAALTVGFAVIVEHKVGTLVALPRSTATLVAGMVGELATKQLDAAAIRAED